jgi:Subtilisin-like serine proteases
VVTLQATQSPTPSWGLDRIDQKALPLNNSYTYPNTGAGVHVYGIDTGILYSHTDFGGRASKGFDAITPGGNAVDCHGHGTHTATTIAGTKYGVAKTATVVGVRVLDCGGSGSFLRSSREWTGSPTTASSPPWRT